MKESVRGRVRKPRKIVLFGVFGIGNIGNEATLWVTLHHLRIRLPDCEVSCVSDALPEFARDYGVRLLPIDLLRVRGANRIPLRFLRWSYRVIATLLTEPLRLWNAVRLLAETDSFVVVGTGALDDLGQQPWQLPAWVLRWCQAARYAGAKVHLLAVGAGPIHGALSRFLMTRAVSAADIRTYRDAYSRCYMANLGLASPRDDVVPDIVFAFPAQWMPLWRPANTPPKVIGVGLMEYFGWNIGGEEGQRIYDTYIAKMSEFVHWLVDSGYDVRLLIGERHTDDKAVRHLLASLGEAQLATSRGRLTSPVILSAHDLLYETMQTDLVVATRFHNLVCALASRRPVVSIGYAPKFEALMEEMNLHEYCQRLDTLDVERLKSQFISLTMKHAIAVREVSVKADAYRSQLERLFDNTFAGPISENSSNVSSQPN